MSSTTSPKKKSDHKLPADWGTPQATALTDGTIIAWGSTVKKTSTEDISFSVGDPPLGIANAIVMVSPYYGGGGEVGHAETINDISDINFSVVSGNAGPYYNVNWIAIGNKGTDWGIPQYTTLPDGTTIAWGSIMKNGPTAEIIFPTKFGLFNPLVVVCPYWRNQKSEVGGAETIDNTTPTTCFVASGNAARNYYVNWIAITAKGNPSGYTAPRHVTLPDGTIIALGSFNKTTAEQNTRFGLELSFPTPPLVVVCPVWTNQHSGVGHAETIYEIYNDAFSVISGNAGQNYYVSWIAIGQAGI